MSPGRPSSKISWTNPFDRAGSPPWVPLVALRSVTRCFRVQPGAAIVALIEMEGVDLMGFWSSV